MQLLRQRSVRFGEAAGSRRKPVGRGHRAPDPGFHAVMGHNLDLAEAMFVAWSTCFNTGRIGHTLKEIIRVLLSRMAACSY